MKTYDAIVIGTGGVGSAAAFHLASRGCRVVGLDRFPGGHDRGSSHGHTRIIRMAYFEHADYVPLLRRAYELWRELEKRSGRRLYYEVGLLEIGPPTGVVVPGVLASARQHGLAIDQLSESDVRSRFPGYVVPSGHAAVFERPAGYLLVEECVKTHLDEARKLGAELIVGQSVMGWDASPTGVTVRTDKETFRAGRLVVTAGAWTQGLLAGLGISLQVRRKHLHWYQTTSDVYRADRGGPCFLHETPEGYFYGFPQVDDRGVKVAEHSGGAVVADPLNDSRAVDAEDRRRVEAFLGRYLPGVSQTPTHHDVCYYTMSPDENFIVDRHPGHSNVCFTAGLSGHGFKFTSVLGEVMAELAMKGATAQPIGFLNCQRFR
jgi:sarcosine oxidase